MVIEEPDIEIGAGVSSKGMYIASVILTSTNTAQRLVDVFLLMPLVVGVETMVGVETSKHAAIMAAVATSTDAETSTSALTSVDVAISVANVAGSTTTVLPSSASTTTVLSMTLVTSHLELTRLLYRLLFPVSAFNSLDSHELKQDA
jgi:hypothetical protein